MIVFCYGGFIVWQNDSFKESFRDYNLYQKTVQTMMQWFSIVIYMTSAQFSSPSPFFSLFLFNNKRAEGHQIAKKPYQRSCLSLPAAREYDQNTIIVFWKQNLNSHWWPRMCWSRKKQRFIYLYWITCFLSPGTK